MNKNPLWYQNAVFYEVYPRAFFDSNGDGHGDLAGLAQKLDYVQSLGIDCLWLLPYYQSPLKDDGYDIADYYSIHPTYGSLDDFKTLVNEAHRRGLRIITDLVLNHTSDQHPWFQQSRQGNPQYRDYYVWSDDNQKYKDARIIFLDSESSNWTWDEKARKYFWHRFYSSQPDLNYDNPAVQQEMIQVMRFWLDLGIDGFRADAVPYLFEREGTNCENLPETHAYLKRIRRFINTSYPGRILLAEANQWPDDVRQYFGDGDEFNMGFHFPIMPRIYMALRQADHSPMQVILQKTPSIPLNCQWAVFLRNHDELTLEMVTDEERQWMWDEYAPEARMRLNLGIRRRLAPLLDNDRRKIEIANSLLFTLPGSPVLYYGDEIGMGDDIWLPDRMGVRTPMQWNKGRNAGFSSAIHERLYAPVISEAPYGPEYVNVEDQQANPGSLWNILHRMITVRKEHPELSSQNMHWIDSHPAVAAYTRSGSGASLLVVHNLSVFPQRLDLPPEMAGKEAVDVLSGESQGTLQPELQLTPYQYLWLRLDG
jgi:maltose alpha-D-glucosyltransferase / alpha-amylase